VSWTLREKHRGILSREEGYHKKVWGYALTVCLAYPNAYRTGMSNLGFQTIYGLINAVPGCLCERVFLPEPEDEAEFTRGGTALFSLESEKPVADFDIVAFSLPFENDYPNILKMLSMSGISLLSQERKKSESIILGGGIAVTLNPEPLADFFDLFILGEAEEAIIQFLDACLKNRNSGLDKEAFLFSLQKGIEGIYVPRLYTVSYGNSHLITSIEPVSEQLPRRIKKRTIPDVNAFLTEQRIFTKDTELGGMFISEVSRGCQRGCRFCAAGFVYRPARFRKTELMQNSFLKALEKGKKIGLLGTAVSDHPEIINLCRFIREREGKVAIGSLRLDKLNLELLLLLKEGGTETIALAPEAGSLRLRELIRKGITDEHIFRAAELLTDAGIENIRLYFMIGLPMEEDEDIDAIIDLTKKIKHHAGKHSRGKRSFKRITLSLNQFIPKAVTPFQWCPLTDITTVKKRIKVISAAFRRESSIRVIHDLPKWNYVQALLSLGDRRVSTILLSVHHYGGNWPQAMKEVNINPDFYVYRQKDTSEILPWDFIDHGVSREFLLKEYNNSL
jgi:radical SAM superfamily enzyme YgiQ (UPF0313 family)